MEPSWTFPIPQAMQQHRGSQEHKPEQLKPREAVVGQAGTAKPSVRSDETDVLKGCG